jgi:glycosyltransferase involved in cell wall biosynthesis
MDHAKFDVSYLFLNATVPDLFQIFNQRSRECTFIKVIAKKDYPFVLLKLLSYIYKAKPDIVHCHLFEASLLGLFAARVCRVKKRIYTRHHSTFHFDYAPHMIKYDRLINRWSTHIVSISENVSSVLEKKELVKKEKIYLVHHGFVMEEFTSTNQVMIDSMINRYNSERRSPVIGVISRFTEWKGIQYVIPAFKKLLIDYPDAFLILANANGDYSMVLDEMLKQLPINSYRKISFEKNVGVLYKLFNIFVHVPIDDSSEAFGQTYVESLAAGIPSVFTLSGIAREFIVDERNSLVVSFKSSEAILMAINRLLTEESLRNKIIEVGLKDVNERFQVEVMIKELCNLYES